MDAVAIRSPILVIFQLFYFEHSRVPHIRQITFWYLQIFFLTRNSISITHEFHIFFIEYQIFRLKVPHFQNQLPDSKFEI